MESQMRDEILALLSHGLRTQVTSILGWAQMLRKGVEPEEVVHGLEIIENNARLQEQLISELLVVNKVLSGKIHLGLECTDVSRVIDSVLEGLRPSAEAKGIRVSVGAMAEDASVQADPTHLGRAIRMLLANSIRFTPRGGEVELTLERSDDQVEISVIDSGVGIAPSRLPLICERFRYPDSPANRESSGLGLPVARTLVELHGGTLHAHSEGQGCGTTVSIVLPVSS